MSSAHAAWFATLAQFWLARRHILMRLSSCAHEPWAGPARKPTAQRPGMAWACALRLHPCCALHAHSRVANTRLATSPARAQSRTACGFCRKRICKYPLPACTESGYVLVNARALSGGASSAALRAHIAIKSCCRPPSRGHPTAADSSSSDGTPAPRRTPCILPSRRWGLAHARAGL